MKREEEGKGYVMREEWRKKKREGGWSDRRKRGSRRGAGEDKRMVNDRTRRWRRGERERVEECDRSLLPSLCVEA